MVTDRHWRAQRIPDMSGPVLRLKPCNSKFVDPANEQAKPLLIVVDFCERFGMKSASEQRGGLTASN